MWPQYQHRAHDSTVVLLWSLERCLGIRVKLAAVTWCGGLRSSGVLRGLGRQLVIDVKGQSASFKSPDVLEKGHTAFIFRVAKLVAVMGWKRSGLE